MLYEDQAAGFDERTGLPPGADEAVAQALVGQVGLEPGDAWLEIGAGTGALSLPFLRLPVRYTGFDRSPAMLSVFREKMELEGLRGELLVADGNERWPVEDGSIAVIFCARALHHLDDDHVVAEIRRVLRPSGGWLVLGRVRRPNDSVKSNLRRQMRRLLESRGYAGRSHDARSEGVFSRLEALGAERSPSIVAARWVRPHRPADSIASWEGKEGLAGIDLPADVKAEVLADLRRWAEKEYGDPTLPLAQEEIFELAPINVRIG